MDLGSCRGNSLHWNSPRLSLPLWPCQIRSQDSSKSSDTEMLQNQPSKRSPKCDSPCLYLRLLCHQLVAAILDLMFSKVSGMGTVADDDPVVGAFFTSRSYILLGVEIMQQSRNPSSSLKGLLSMPCALNSLLDFSFIWGATVWEAVRTT